MRILVTGSRELTDVDLVRDEIVDATDTPAPWTMVVGDCPTGADKFAREFWQEVIEEPTNPEDQSNLDVHTADWTTHGKAAGPLRNQTMVDSGADICLAFYREGAGNRGTADCVRRARTAGIEVHEFTERGAAFCGPAPR